MRLFRPRQRETTDIDPATAHRLIADGAHLIDVREPHEFASGHAPRAVNLPLGELVRGTRALPGSGALVVVCHSGARSGRAVAHLRRAGHDALNLAGGMLAWQRAGLSVTRDLQRAR